MSDAPRHHPDISEQQEQWFREIREEENRRGRPNGPWKSEEAKPSIEPFITVDASSWHGKVRPTREWLDQRSLIPHASVTNFTGIGAVGKTLLMLQLCVSCVTSSNWLGATVRSGPALFYSAEEPIEEMHIRCDEICEAENIFLDAVKGLHIIDLSQVENATLIRGDNRTGMAGPTDLFRRLEKTLALIRPVVLILDNRGLLVTGNESDRNIAATAMRLLRLLADKHQCAIILLSHPSKGGKGDGDGSSGSTAWFATGRSALNMERPQKEDGEVADKKARTLTSQKANYAEEGTTVNLRWEFNRFICTDKVPTADDGIGVMSKVERVYLDLLRLTTAQGFTFTPNAAPKEFGRMSKEKRHGFNSIWFSKAQEALLDRGRLHLVDGRKSGRSVKIVAEVDYNS
jgi:RecA-family ATPase